MSNCENVSIHFTRFTLYLISCIKTSLWAFKLKTLVQTSTRNMNQKKDPKLDSTSTVQITGSGSDTGTTLPIGFLQNRKYSLQQLMSTTSHGSQVSGTQLLIHKGLLVFSFSWENTVLHVGSKCKAMTMPSTFKPCWSVRTYRSCCLPTKHWRIYGSNIYFRMVRLIPSPRARLLLKKSCSSSFPEHSRHVCQKLRAQNVMAVGGIPPPPTKLSSNHSFHILCSLASCPNPSIHVQFEKNWLLPLHPTHENPSRATSPSLPSPFWRTTTPTPMRGVLAEDAALAAVHGRGVLGVEVLGLFVLVAVHEAEHARPRLVGQRVRLEVGLERGWEREVVDAVDGGLRDDGATRQLLQAQHWKWTERERHS